MATNTKPIKDSLSEAGEVSAHTAATFATLMHRSVERMAALQKAALDTLGTQTEDLNKTVRETLKVPSNTPVKSFFDLADQSLQGWISAQKTIVDLMVQQSAYITDAAKERTAFSKPGEFLSELFRESTERVAEIDKTVLEYAASQNKNVAETIRKQAGVSGTPLASATEAVEKNVSAVIDAQKDALDTAVKLPLAAKA